MPKEEGIEIWKLVLILVTIDDQMWNLWYILTKTRESKGDKSHNTIGVT